MVSRFRRTLSFPTKPKPNPNPNPNPSRPSPPPDKSYHVRSISLPCRSHPLISQLQSEIQQLRTWQQQQQQPSQASSSAWACDGLIMLKSLHDSVDDLLQLPQTQESLRGRPEWAERLLEDFLRFADVYGILRAALMALKEEQLGVQVAVRRREESRIGAYVRARKKMDKEVKRLVSEVRSVGRRPVPDGSLLVLVDGNAELAMILRDVYDVTVSATISILNGIVSSGSCLNCGSWMLWKKSSSSSKREEMRVREFEGVEEVEKLWGMLRKRKGGGEEAEAGVMRRCVLGKMEELEKCIGEMESGTEGVFRSFVCARVSLLNILTQ